LFSIVFFKTGDKLQTSKTFHFLFHSMIQSSLFSVIPFLLVSLLGSAHAGLLFSDNFSTSGQSDDVNFEYTGGRQSGSLGNLQYLQGNVLNGLLNTGTISNEASNGYVTQVGGAAGTLWLGTTAPPGFYGSISPQHNFTENPGLGGYLSVSFLITPALPSTGTSDDWGAVTIGAGDNASFGTSGTGARGQFVNAPGAHFGILFRANGDYQAFNGSSAVASGTYSATPTITLAHAVELRISGLVDGNPWDGVNDAQIDVFVNGEDSPFYTYIATGGYTNNYITLMGLNQTSQFDNLKISIVPEPSLGLISLAISMVIIGVVRARAAARRA